MKFRAIRFRPRLVLVLLLISASLLSVPVGAVLYLNILENYLIRQTQRSLELQGDLIVSTYRAIFQRSRPSSLAIERYGRANLHHVGHQKRHSKFLYYDSTQDRYTYRFRSWLDVIVGPLEIDLSRKRIQPNPSPLLRGDPADQLAAIVGTNLDDELKEASHTIKSTIHVTDYYGIIVSSTEDNVGDLIGDQREVKHALDGNPVVSLHELVEYQEPPFLKTLLGSTDMLVQTTIPIILENRVLGVSILQKKLRTTYEFIEDYTSFIALSGAIFIFLLLLASILVSRVVTGPIRTLIIQTDRVKKGERGAVRSTLGPKEVDELSDAVASMAETLEKKNDYIRFLAVQLTHDFKTPLSLIHGAVEVITDHLDTMSEKERKKFLSQIDTGASRLDMLIHRQLELATAEIMEIDTDARSNVYEVLEQITERYDPEEIKLKWELDTRSIETSMEGKILDSVVGGLVDNSYKHGGDGVTVTVNAKAPSDSEKFVQIDINDSGAGIADENIDQIFSIKFTTSKEISGSGIGLPAIKAILEAHHGSIDLLSSSPGRTTFSVLIPLYRR